MSAADILKMIETVDPTDTATLDEIDARVWCYLNSVTLKKPSKNMWKNFEDDYTTITYKDNEKEGLASCGWAAGTNHIQRFCKYTRSRDALKAIRPEGCWVERIIQHKTSKSWDCTIAITGEVFSVSDKAITLPTEELAELHAIIQAIEYERNAP